MIKWNITVKTDALWTRIPIEFYTLFPLVINTKLKTHFFPHTSKKHEKLFKSLLRMLNFVFDSFDLVFGIVYG